MSALLDHFSLLDTDREHDHIGPRIEVVVFLPWRQKTELWGEAYVQRVEDELEAWAIVETAPDYPFDPYDYPIFRLPETMAAEFTEIRNDWRGMALYLAELSGMVYARRT